jgi:hypothetical protein
MADSQQNPVLDNTQRPVDMLFLNNRSRIVGKISRMAVAHGDVILLMVNEQIHPGTLTHIVQACSQRFPENPVLPIPKNINFATVNCDELIKRIKEAQKQATKNLKERLKREKEARKEQRD